MYALAGVVGNTVVLIVFSRSREYMNTNFKVYALFHGVIDLVTCVTVIPGEIFRLRHYFDYIYGTLCKFTCFMNIFGAAAAAFILMLISMERFHRVNRPLNTQISPRMCARICWICIIFAILLASPAAFFCGIENKTITNINAGNTTAHFCVVEDKFKQTVWLVVYKQSLFILTGIFLVLSILIYVSIWRTVHAATNIRMAQGSFKIRGKRTDQLFNSEKKTIKGKTADEDFERTLTEEEQKMSKSCIISQSRSLQRTYSDRMGPFPYKTLIWFILTVMFISTRILYCALSLVQYDILSFPHPLLTLIYFFYRLYFINSVINPFVYAILDSRFRCSFRRIFREMICF
ncbi:hypothetical protein ACJMK2_038379 [Sinanodonta woodiana]|uniref:G-protein coupled receptors family 1 profile domain-containing protein n=1 Tax=Sinanodonta woodiana TaxID=1069815 RepID=A0ABD3WAP9_SINWO